MILITGPTGAAGGAVLRELVARKTPGLRAMYRQEKDRAAAPAGVDAVIGDFNDSASLAGAMAGVTSAFCVCSPIPDLVRLETNFLHAAKEAGVAHVVLFSALGAGDFPKSFPSWHRKVEDKARELALPVTILRPNGFMQNIVAYQAPTIRTQDAFYSTIGHARINLIDLRDIADCVANALTSASTIGHTYELSGPDAVSYDDVTARISRLVGRPIHYVSISPGQMGQALAGFGLPDWNVKALLELDEYYQSGKGAASDAALRGLLGKNPRRLDDFLAENVAAFRKD